MNSSTMSLNRVPEGGEVMIQKLLTQGSMRRRLQDIGFIHGATVKCLQKSPSGDPVAYLVQGAVIAIRSEDSCQILVESLS